MTEISNKQNYSNGILIDKNISGEEIKYTTVKGGTWDTRNNPPLGQFLHTLSVSSEGTIWKKEGDKLWLDPTISIIFVVTMMT